MEALYITFQVIPLAAVKLQGLIQLIVIVGILIFKLIIPKPKKEK